ncbi:hypothetical protein F4802DRAFT_600644 [Xylaria palmicola]|nr:hypothetical protein F4802DRAFT_600644 [Xylaria palmicola]
MADQTPSIEPKPIPLPVMGMTAEEYQIALIHPSIMATGTDSIPRVRRKKSSYLDHANFAREMEQDKNQRRKVSLRLAPYWQRIEFWALTVGVISFVHAMFVQWGWPAIQPLLSRDSVFSLYPIDVHED